MPVRDLVGPNVEHPRWPCGGLRTACGRRYAVPLPQGPLFASIVGLVMRDTHLQLIKRCGEKLQGIIGPEIIGGCLACCGRHPAALLIPPKKTTKRGESTSSVHHEPRWAIIIMARRLPLFSGFSISWSGSGVGTGNNWTISGLRRIHAEQNQPKSVLKLFKSFRDIISSFYGHQERSPEWRSGVPCRIIPYMNTIPYTTSKGLGSLSWMDIVS